MAVIVTVHNRKKNTLHQLYSVDAREMCRASKDCVPVTTAGAAALRAKPQKLSTQAAPPRAPVDPPGSVGRGGDLSNGPTVVETEITVPAAPEAARPVPEPIPEGGLVEALPEPSPLLAALDASEPVAVSDESAQPVAVPVASDEDLLS